MQPRTGPPEDIMVGDVKQLASIRPGNLLEETEIVMRRLGSFVSFFHNHRVKEAGAKILDDNAKAIAAKQIYKLRFDGKHAVHMDVPEAEGGWRSTAMPFGSNGLNCAATWSWKP